MKTGKCPEQICPGENRYYKKELKKISKRARRRQEKQDLENCPKRNVYRGYSI